jgi:hypothetical protein
MGILKDRIQFHCLKEDHKIQRHGLALTTESNRVCLYPKAERIQSLKRCVLNKKQDDG